MGKILQYTVQLAIFILHSVAGNFGIASFVLFYMCMLSINTYLASLVVPNNVMLCLITLIEALYRVSHSCSDLFDSIIKPFRSLFRSDSLIKGDLYVKDNFRRDTKPAERLFLENKNCKEMMR